MFSFSVLPDLDTALPYRLHVEFCKIRLLTFFDPAGVVAAIPGQTWEF